MPAPKPEPIDCSGLVSELPPLGWGESEFAPTKAVDAEWLIERLVAYQDPGRGSGPSKYGNAPALAGDLFEAGFEDDDLAWVWGEPKSSPVQDELLAAMRRLGIGLLPNHWIAARNLQDLFRDYLEKRISLRALSSLAFAWVYDEEVHFRETAYILDHLDDFDDHARAIDFVKDMLPRLEALDEEMTATVAAHLNRLPA